MLLKDVLSVNEALKKLCEKRLKNFKTSRSLSKLLKKVDDETGFYSQEYKKLLDIYAKKDPQGNLIMRGKSSFELKDPDSKVKYEQEFKDLLETDVGQFEPVSVNESDFVDTNDLPTAQEMNLLEIVINWDDVKLN